MRRTIAVLAALAACALSAPAAQAQTTAQCLADHTGDAPVGIRGKVAAERTITANTLRDAVAAGTMTAKTISVEYLSGTTPNKRTYVGIPLHEVMMDLT